MLKSIAIVGLGYVGLPLLEAFLSTKKYNLIGYDNDVNKIKKLKKKNKFIKKNVVFSDGIKSIKNAHYIIIALPTPITKSKEPDNINLNLFFKNLSKINLKNKVISMESTVYPTATTEFLLPIFKAQKLKVGYNVFLGYSPERIDPSNKKFLISNIPKIVSGFSKKCLKKINELYSDITKTVVASNIETAEFTKCYENIFRSINISFANEMKVLSHKINLDIFEIIKLANTKPFGIYPFYPGPGMGGHCIPVDPHIMSWFAKKNNFYTRFIELAGQINDSMPNYIVKRLLEHSIKNNNTKNNKVLILGIAYKKNVSDIRESSSLEICRLLKKVNFDVYYHDPLVKKEDIKKYKIKNLKKLNKNLRQFSYVLCLTDHDIFDYNHIYKYSNYIVDTRNRFKKSSIKILNA